MPETNPMGKIQSELQEGIELPKCRRCGCMEESLESLQSFVSSPATTDFSALAADIERWLEWMGPIRYACLGCDYCFPAVAMNLFHTAFPEVGQRQSLECTFEMSEHYWPPIAGEYYALCHGSACPVAVSSLGSIGLSERLARIRPKELCIVGKTETENIGIDKIIKNTVSNPTIRYLLLAGSEPKGHETGKTLLALGKNGVDEDMKVIGAPGRRSILRNVARAEVEAFRNQVQVVDMIGCEDENRIVQELKRLCQDLDLSCGCEESEVTTKDVRLSEVPTTYAEEPVKVEMDKAGYFVILPQPERQIIVVEHYAYDNTLQRVIDGKDARSIYWTIIRADWVTQLSHAAYLGKELAKAELSMKMGFKYVQEGA